MAKIYWEKLEKYLLINVKEKGIVKMILNMHHGLYHSMPFEYVQHELLDRSLNYTYILNKDPNAGSSITGNYLYGFNIIKDFINDVLNDRELYLEWDDPDSILILESYELAVFLNPHLDEFIRTKMLFDKTNYGKIPDPCVTEINKQIGNKKLCKFFVARKVLKASKISNILYDLMNNEKYFKIYKNIKELIFEDAIYLINQKKKIIIKNNNWC